MAFDDLLTCPATSMVAGNALRANSKWVAGTPTMTSVFASKAAVDRFWQMAATDCLLPFNFQLPPTTKRRAIFFYCFSAE